MFIMKKISATSFALAFNFTSVNLVNSIRNRPEDYPFKFCENNINHSPFLDCSCCTNEIAIYMFEIRCMKKFCFFHLAFSIFKLPDSG